MPSEEAFLSQETIIAKFSDKVTDLGRNMDLPYPPKGAFLDVFWRNSSDKECCRLGSKFPTRGESPIHFIWDIIRWDRGVDNCLDYLYRETILKCLDIPCFIWQEEVFYFLLMVVVCWGYIY